MSVFSVVFWITWSIIFLGVTILFVIFAYNSRSNISAARNIFDSISGNIENIPLDWFVSYFQKIDSGVFREVVFLFFKQKLGMKLRKRYISKIPCHAIFYPYPFYPKEDKFYLQLRRVSPESTSSLLSFADFCHSKKSYGLIFCQGTLCDDIFVYDSKDCYEIRHFIKFIGLEEMYLLWSGIRKIEDYLA